MRTATGISTHNMGHIKPSEYESTLSNNAGGDHTQHQNQGSESHLSLFSFFVHHIDHGLLRHLAQSSSDSDADSLSAITSSSESVASQTAAGSKAPENCRILHDTFSVMMQGVLFLVCFAVFVMKWRLEKNRRPFLIFAMDSSKQVIGAGWVHTLNMVCAITFKAFLPAPAANASSGFATTTDECGWYWVNIMVDTTIGVWISYCFLKIAERKLGFQSGNYRDNVATESEEEFERLGNVTLRTTDNSKYYSQLFIWLSVVTCMKITVVFIMLAFASMWAVLANIFTGWISDAGWRLAFVMIITPCVMNIIQFIITDTFLRYYGTEKAKQSSQMSSTDLE